LSSGTVVQAGKSLDPTAPVFIPEQYYAVENPEPESESLEAGTQILAKSPQVDFLTTCVDQTSSVHVVKPLLECSDVDDDITQYSTESGFICVIVSDWLGSFTWCYGDYANYFIPQNTPS